MGSESSLWKTLNKNMKEYWVADRIENSIGSGTPDVYYTIKGTGVGGWNELKHVHSWPKKWDTPLRLPHFTKHQKAFLKQHGKIGGHMFVLLQVERDYMLFNWMHLHLIGISTKNELIKYSNHWRNSINYNELKELLEYIPF